VQTTATPIAARPETAAPSLDRVGDVDRPRAELPIVSDLGDLPGTSNPLAGLVHLVGVSRYGVDYQRTLVERYGEVFQHRFGPYPIVVVADPTRIVEIARNADGAWSTALGWWSLFGGIERQSETIDFPVTLGGGDHRELRRLLQPAFGRAAMGRYVETTDETLSPTIDRWVADGRVSLKREARTAFAHLANRIFVGVDDPALSSRMDGAMADFWRGMNALVRSPVMSPTWRRALRGYESTRATLRAMVPDRRANGGDDLFAALCRAEDPPAWMDDDGLVRVMFGIMAAAFDTTSVGVTSMAYALATNPAWQERLREEALASDDVSFASIKSLAWHDRAWKETLRLYPVANSLPRRALRDVEVNGHRVPAGALVMAELAPAMRDPARWSAPNTFRPERFADDGEARANRGAYQPFGAGAHSCIGAVLSGLEAVTFFRALLRRCRIRLAKPYEARHQFTPLGCVSGDVELVLERV